MTTNKMNMLDTEPDTEVIRDICQCLTEHGLGDPRGAYYMLFPAASLLEGNRELGHFTMESPYNGMTYDAGEVGADPVQVCRRMGKRDCINHVHYRNVIVRIALRDYTEVSPDEGMVNLLEVMKELVRQKYSRAVYAEYPCARHQDDISRGWWPGR